MAHVLSGAELVTQRLPRQWAKTRLIIPAFHSIYTARLNGVPASDDMVAEITVDTEAGTLAEVLQDMMLYVGTTAGDYDLGVCRIRKTPITGTFYLAETSEIVWQDAAFLTVIDDYSLWAKPLRIVSEVAYMDWDIAYSDQHADFDPVPCMGSDAVARLEGASVDVLLGPSADVPAWVEGSTITSQVWSCAGATFDDATLVNPTATFTAAGTYLAYCLFTAANGKTFTGVRYVVIYNDANPGLEDFEIRNGHLNQETGSCSFDVTLFSGFSATTLRKRTKVILVSEDYAGNASVTMPGQIPGRENIVCVGWISGIDNSRTSEFGEISLVVESAEFWMKSIRDYPSGLEIVPVGSDDAWTDMPLLSVDRAVWHFLHWRSTATRIMDVTLTGDTRLASRFNIARANLWERIGQVTRPTIFAHPGMDNFGRLFVSIEPQMVPEVDRTWPVVMTLTDDDIENGITWRRRDVAALSMLFLSGISVSATGGASSYFSMSPGHSYGHYGEEEPQDNYLVSDQAGSNELCGLYYGWRNNDPYDLNVNFSHSMRVIGCWPRQYFAYTVSPADDPRGIGFAKNFLVREITFNQDPTNGFISYSALLEPESLPGPAINGDVPTMEEIDFSYPNPLPKIPPMLAPFWSLPYTYPSPTEATEELPKKIVIATTLGVLYTVNADEPVLTDIIWQFMNNGLDANDLSQIAQLVVTPNGTLYILTNGTPSTGYSRVFRATSLGAAWTEVFTATNRTYNGVPDSIVRVVGLGVNRYLNDEIGIVDTATYIAFGATDTGRFYTGSTSFGAGANIFVKSRIAEVAPMFEASKWFVFGSHPTGIGGSLQEPWLYRFTAAGVAETDASIYNGNNPVNQACHGQAANGKLHLWIDSNNDGYWISEPDIVTWTFYDEATYAMDPLGSQGMAISPTGTHALGSLNGTSTPKQSTDSLTTWASVGGVIPVGSDVWENCNDNFRWLFGGGSTGPRFTPDQGNTTYDDLSGNLGVIAAARDITHIRFIE